MSKEQEQLKQDYIAHLEMLLKSVKQRIADPKNAALKEYLEGYEAGCLMALEIIKAGKTD